MLFWNHSYCFLQAANRNVYLRHFSTGFTFQTWTCPLWCSHTARSPFIQLLTAVPLRTHNLWFSARIGEENEIICCWFSLLFWTIQGSRMSHFFQTFQPQFVSLHYYMLWMDWKASSPRNIKAINRKKTMFSCLSPLTGVQRLLDGCHGSLDVSVLKGHGRLHHQDAAVSQSVVHAVPPPAHSSSH